MSIRVVVHVMNEQPFVADIEELPGPTATNVYLRNPRMRDHKPVPWASGNIHGAIFPLTRISFLEVAITQADEHEVVGFYKDETRGY
jgi:hypothetical protein